MILHGCPRMMLKLKSLLLSTARTCKVQFFLSHFLFRILLDFRHHVYGYVISYQDDLYEKKIALLISGLNEQWVCLLHNIQCILRCRFGGLRLTIIHKKVWKYNKRSDTAREARACDMGNKPGTAIAHAITYFPYDTSSVYEPSVIITTTSSMTGRLLAAKGKLKIL